MTVAALGASHSPLMHLGDAPGAARQAVAAAFRELALQVERFEPDLVVQFSPDHYNAFFYDLMPSFCVGIEAHSVGDYGTQAGPLRVPAREALDLVEALHRHDIDAALSYRMPLDHGFTQIWEEMFGSATRFPMIPVFVNCAAPPLPSFRRARLLGEAVGKFAGGLGERVLFVASGGLSHDPPFPEIGTAPREKREGLIAGRNPSADERAARVKRVVAAGAAAGRGEGPCQPLNEEWDRQFMHRLGAGDPAVFDAVDTAEVRAIAGRGGNETLAWVAAFSALATQGSYRSTFEFYEPVPTWIAGMGMMFGELRN